MKDNDFWYWFLDLTERKCVLHPSRKAPDPSNDVCCTTELWFRRIPAGRFLMGSPATEIGRYGNEPLHAVFISKDFLLGVFPVTQRQWELVMGQNPSYFQKAGPTAPVEQVSFQQICGYSRMWPKNDRIDEDSFLGRLRARTGDTSLDLPTEAQWEYACRAGTTTALCNGKNLTQDTVCGNLDGIAWYKANSGGATHPVGRKAPNAWGLYDMLGNVWEWCRDWHGGVLQDNAVDPEGNPAGFSRVQRGGTWACRAGECRAARRYDDDEARRYRNLGLRLQMAFCAARAV